MHYQEIEGDLIKLAQQGTFEVIAHGCNCMCTMGAGIAPQMAKAFGADKFVMEGEEYRGDINKLGQIDYDTFPVLGLTVVNAYTQYNYGRNHIDGDIAPIDYVAFTMCMRKMNHIFKGKHIGMPKIGAGLAGGDWQLIHQIIVRELKDCIVTVVIYKPE
jgi:O-acetyl-ADP-ribose deacetylase (regulator of RNase III)